MRKRKQRKRKKKSKLIFFLTAPNVFMNFILFFSKEEEEKEVPKPKAEEPTEIQYEMEVDPSLHGTKK
jgi:hypothetical protein